MDTFDVSQHVSGVVIDALKAIAMKLNFTITFHLRKDRKWGSVTEYSNGTLVATGMVGDVYHERANIIAAYPVMTENRVPYLDFLAAEYVSGD